MVKQQKQKETKEKYWTRKRRYKGGTHQKRKRDTSTQAARFESLFESSATGMGICRFVDEALGEISANACGGTWTVEACWISCGLIFEPPSKGRDEGRCECVVAATE